MRAAPLRECGRSENVAVWTAYLFSRYASSDAERSPPPPEPVRGSSGVRKSARGGVINLMGKASGLLPAELGGSREGFLANVVKAVRLRRHGPHRFRERGRILGIHMQR